MPTAPIYGLPGQTELIAEIVLGLAALSSIFYCVSRAWGTRSMLPIYLLIGSGLCSLYEPYADVLGQAIYPELGTHVLVEMLGRRIPLFVGFIYLFYFPTAFVYLGERFNAGLTLKKWTYICIATIGSACIFEMLPVHYRLWTYYGAYVGKIHGFPVVWGFLNGQSVLGGAVVLHLILSKIRPVAYVAAIGLVPLVFFGLHFAAAHPLYSVLNSTTNPLMIALGTLLSCLASVGLCWYYGTLVCRNAEGKGLPRA